MRIRKDTQGRLQFERSTLQITNEFYERYEAISALLDENPSILDVLHRDLGKVIEEENRAGAARGRPCNYTSENLLRILMCQAIEGESLRDIVVRIDDSFGLRQFVRVYDGPMMNYTTLCRLKNCVSEKTWRRVNQIVAKSAIAAGVVEGSKLRLDTTAVETNIRWPSDSGLLWDVYRVLSRSLERAREVDPAVVGTKRLRVRNVKRLHQAIAREGRKSQSCASRMQRLYKALLGHVERILGWARATADGLEKRQVAGRYGAGEMIVAQVIASIRECAPRGDRVVDQARRRVLQNEKLSSTEKLYSIFEPHTELLKRGKAGKPIEFGHMVLLQQTKEKIITDYKVFAAKPIEHLLVESAVKSHVALFGAPPQELAADKGFFKANVVERLRKTIDVVSIGKSGHRTDEDRKLESSVFFKLAQAFRAGIEGTISVLKRAMRLARCFDKGWEHYTAAVGRIVFAHNLVVLARGTSG